MSTYSIKDACNSTDRYKLYIALCNPDEIHKTTLLFQNQGIAVVDIGNEVARFLNDLADFEYLHIDVYDFLKKLLDGRKTKLQNAGNDIVAISNLGILFEPALELNPTLLIKEISKTSALIIIWENQLEVSDRLTWSTQSKNYFIDLSDTQLKKLQYAI